MSGMDGCPCGCPQSAEAKVMAAKEAAEHRADFERYLDDRSARLFPPLPADEETDALLALVRIPVAKVSVVG